MGASSRDNRAIQAKDKKMTSSQQVFQVTSGGSEGEQSDRYQRALGPRRADLTR